MAQGSALLLLLEAETEPSSSLYKNAAANAINHPNQINFSSEPTLKLGIAAHSHRFAKFFFFLHSNLPSPNSPVTTEVATKTTELLTRILPELYGLPGPVNVVEYLLPALRICIAPSQPLKLRALATTLSTCGNLLERIASDPSGSEVIQHWVHLPATLALDNVSLNKWTERMAKMVSSCICMGDHHITSELQRWRKLKILMKDFQEETATCFCEALSGSTLTDDTKELLRTFELPIPGSKGVLESQLLYLKSVVTASILRCIIATLPCKQCLAGLESQSQDKQIEIPEDVIQTVSNIQLDVLGKAVGIWTVLLSALALKSIQTLSRLGLFGPVKEKLAELASGRFTSKLAGSSKERGQLKVPLSTTNCGRNLMILWQVYLGFPVDSQCQEQEMIIWEVGDSGTVSKALSRIIVLQQNYSDELIFRCRQRPRLTNGVCIPIRFDDHSLDLTRPRKASQDLDVRTADPSTIEMANKFYALTEPVIRSVLNNDLAAELPFNLSKDEAQCIRQFKTASLILGRSGTGKTTCLVFKLVGKFLTSKAVKGEKSARQVRYP